MIFDVSNKDDFYVVGNPQERGFKLMQMITKRTMSSGCTHYQDQNIMV
jgi:hypothetical protein